MRKPAQFSSHATLREALYDVVHHSRIPAKVQAEELGIAYSYLCNAANPNLDGNGFDYQLRLLIPHTRLTDNYASLDYIERALGRVGIAVCEPFQPGSSPRVEELAAGLLLIAKEMGQAAEAVHRSVKDGRLTEEEARRCQKELWDLIQQATCLYGRLILEGAER
jgi:hypothetical protein